MVREVVVLQGLADDGVLEQHCDNIVGMRTTNLTTLVLLPPSNRHHQSNGDCLEGKWKIIRSVLCSIVCNNCAQCSAYTYEQT